EGYQYNNNPAPAQKIPLALVYNRVVDLKIHEMSGLFGCFCLDEKKDGLGMDQEGDNTILAIDLYNKGTVAQAKGNLEEAINFYKQSISLDGENFKAFYNLGSALQETAAGL
ncbi:unnamed protein product, partial [Heterosigma akashiwo]